MSFNLSYSRSVDPASKGGRKILLLFIVLAVVFLAIAVITGIRQTAKLRHYIPVDAKIVAMDHNNYPTVEYRANGKIIKKHLTSTTSNYDIGKTLRIAFNPEAPEDTIERGFMGYLATCIMGFLFLCFGLIGVTGFLYARRTKKSETAPWEQ